MPSARKGFRRSTVASRMFYLRRERHQKVIDEYLLRLFHWATLDARSNGLAAFDPFVAGTQDERCSRGDSACSPGAVAPSSALTRARSGPVRLDDANHLDKAVPRRQTDGENQCRRHQDLQNAFTGDPAARTAPIGNENYPSLGPACSDKYVALVNGSTLYVLDRTDGRPVKIRQVGACTRRSTGTFAEIRHSYRS